MLDTGSSRFLPAPLKSADLGARRVFLDIVDSLALTLPVSLKSCQRHERQSLAHAISLETQ